MTNYRVDQIFKNHWKVIEGIAVGEKITAFNAYDTEGNSEELKITNCFCLVWLSYSMHSLTPMANFVRNANSKIEFIGLSGDTENEKWLKMVKNNKWQGIKQVCSPGIESDLNTNGVPCLLVVNEGKIVFVGHPNEVDLNASIETFPVVATKVEEDVGGRNEWLFEKEGVYLKEVCEKARMVIRERTGTFNCEFILKLEKNCCNGKVVRRAIPMIMGTVSKPEYVILIELKQEIEDKFALEGIEIKVRLLQ